LDTEEEIIRNKGMSLIALQELLSDANTQRPDMSDEISKIEEALKDVEDVKNYVKKFNDLEQLVNNFVTDADNEPPNPRNIDRSARLKKIRKAINEYRNAYANYAAHLIEKKGH
jgi:predicted DNA-binding protein YlxM (UPF0122 family)